MFSITEKSDVPFYVLLVVIFSAILVMTFKDYGGPSAAPPEPKTVFQIGKCYLLENNNPFEKTELVIDIIDIQGDYIQFGVSLNGAWSGVNSTYGPSAAEICTEVHCQKIQTGMEVQP